MHRHFQSGRPGHYAELVKDYLVGLATTAPARILSAQFGGGVSARQDHSGEIVVNVPGHGEMSFGAAVHSGLLGFG
jgi:hypothetical protein